MDVIEKNVADVYFHPCFFLSVCLLLNVAVLFTHWMPNNETMTGDPSVKRRVETVPKPVPNVF